MALETFSLRDRAALVIGAGGAIGRAVAVALAEAGADVAVATSTRAQKEEVVANSCANEVWALNRRGFAQAIDAASESDVSALLQRAVSELGRLDVLVNAHDLPFARPLPDTTLAEWQRVIEVNLTGVFLACRAAAAPMLAQGSGRIINVVSLLGERGMSNGSAFCAAQAGVLNLTRSLALEWARSGVKVNAIGAGWTEGMGLLNDEAARQQLERFLPQRRLASPEEIAGAAVYVASEAADYLTGQILWIDGGALTHA
jgi:NAD(P)-dependent dehydrogenase (short-subunit alcohol dehydrogenase family)